MQMKELRDSFILYRGKKKLKGKKIQEEGRKELFQFLID